MAATTQRKKTAPPAGKHGTSPKFKPTKVYKFGVIQMNTEGDPQWRKTPLSQYGSFFIKSGCRSLKTWLEKNPNGFDPKQVLHFYEVDENGNLKYFGQGNPAPRMEADSADMLNDSIGNYFGGSKQQSNGSGQEVIDILQRQIDQQNLTIREQGERIEAAYNEAKAEIEKRMQLQTAFQVELEKNKAKEVANKEMERLADSFEKERSGGLEGALSSIMTLLDVAAPLIEEFVERRKTAKSGAGPAKQPRIQSGSAGGDDPGNRFGQGRDVFDNGPQYDIDEED